MITATCRLLFPINRKQYNPLNFFCIREFASVQDFTTPKSKHDIEKDSLPPKPKRPPNIFLQYYVSMKNKLQAEYPNFNQRELLKKASEKWTQVDSTIKQNLQKQYDEQTSVYKQKLKDYESSLTPNQKIQRLQESVIKGRNPKKTELKQILVEHGMPKRPLSGFMLFLQNKRVTKKPQELQKDWLNNATKEWKSMTTEAKSEYNEEAKDLLGKYKIEIEKWKKDMTNADQWHGSAENLVLYNDKHALQTMVKYPKNTAMDTSINNVKKSVVQLYDTNLHTKIRMYFVSTWERILTVLKEISKNWKTKLY
ncbi:transcription factor A, mitochondrial isoform X2 [Monomorium pharaonis]|uniref:transcription factor A, mitochondrial isoform X2 n=1 Tax=Monomorium pharaonis TaxID=307658 RepID=UPI00063FB6EF|nr:transcription factor A, mitochondrial isoform X2 [Monomorium pharaonis]